MSNDSLFVCFNNKIKELELTDWVVSVVQWTQCSYVRTTRRPVKHRRSWWRDVMVERTSGNWLKTPSVKSGRMNTPRNVHTAVHTYRSQRCLCYIHFMLSTSLLGPSRTFIFLDTLPLLKVVRTFSCRTLLEVIFCCFVTLFSDIGRCELFDSFSLVYSFYRRNCSIKQSFHKAVDSV